MPPALGELAHRAVDMTVLLRIEGVCIDKIADVMDDVGLEEARA